MPFGTRLFWAENRLAAPHQDEESRVPNSAAGLFGDVNVDKIGAYLPASAGRSASPTECDETAEAERGQDDCRGLRSRAWRIVIHESEGRSAVHIRHDVDRA